MDAQLDVKIADLELGYNSRPEDGAGDENGDEDSLHSILSHTTLAEFYSSAMISPWQPPEVSCFESVTAYRIDLYNHIVDISWGGLYASLRYLLSCASVMGNCCRTLFTQQATTRRRERNSILGI